ncbi:choice-of-anchor C family protein [Loktanella sp. M215]|uniref:choice-of-anchor C family protein n=1 Tax=Loktanella sp. M215 TaxID=2675431 RepID=UPI001F44757E|nr:choice-of-anchor C family protein [Loktanella sp. M215]MCF7702113.1 choice-of-anchor C family protein [Loktanella sp. M215]
MLKKILSASALGLALFSGAASAATITNGSFEIGAAPGSFTELGNGSTSITGWTVGPKNIDYIGSYWTAQDGGRSLDLSGSAKGSISTTITDLIVNATYELSFWMSGNPAGQPTEKKMDVTLANPATTERYGYNIQTSANTLTDMKWQEFVLKFTATSTSSLLTFAAGNGGGGAACCYGPALDNVSIAAVPLPASGLLLFGAFGGIAALRRRRKLV